MTHDIFAMTWFGLWGLIWIFYFLLDGYKLGAGIIYPFVTKNRQQQIQLKDAIGPFWGGNEVLLIAAGGATFAAFPGAYADVFSFLNEAIFFILFSQLIRAMGLALMLKSDSPKRQTFWKWAFSVASFLISFLFGVIYTNLYHGVLSGENVNEWSFLGLMNGYGILGGFLFVVMFLLSGSVWIQLKTRGKTAYISKRLSKPLVLMAVPVLAAFFLVTMNWTPLVDNFNGHPVLRAIPILSFMGIILATVFIFKDRIRAAFTFVCFSIIMQMATGFIGLFHNMPPSKINDSFSVTLYQAAGNTLNFKLMATVGLFLVPIIIFLIIWRYVSYKEKELKEKVIN